MKKALAIVLVTLLCMAFFVGCSQSSVENGSMSSDDITVDEGQGTQSGDDEFVIGYSNYSDADFFCKYVLDITLDKAKEQGIKVINTDAEVDIEKQLNQIDNFIAQNVDVIVIGAVDSDGVISGVKAANNAGIPVVAVMLPVNGGEFFYVGADNSKVGVLQAEYFADHLPENAEVCYLQGSMGLTNSVFRRDGFINTLKDLRPDVTILDEQDGNYLRTEGQRITEDWLQVYPDLDAIGSTNDQMALGAIEALKGANKEGVMVCGIDATDDALLAIKNGDMTLSMRQSGEDIAQATVDLLLMAKNGEELSDNYVDWILVDEKNVDEYLE
ncbi:MAG: sugar ABC transporter substrate-binding protein [Christensenellales bacterium]